MRRMRFRQPGFAGALLATALLGWLPARAESVADFYRGKTIEFVIGAAAAGGYDVAGRSIASHMSRHIPGRPTIVVRNMQAPSA